MFSPWRMDYIRGGGSGGERCIFCIPDEVPRDPERLVLGVYANTVAICNRYPYNNGHVLIAPRRHVADPALLSGEEMREIMSLLALGTKAISAEYSPRGFNVGMNLGKTAGAGIPDHLHLHLVPRWEGDTNFMTSVLSTRVLPESLEQTHRRLSALFGPLTP